jgi:hypothetical protein
MNTCASHPQPPTVALVDTRWGGHHPTYLREFTAGLLRIGARALLVCREPARIGAEFPNNEAAGRIAGLRFVHRNHALFDRRRDHDPASTLLRWRATGRALDLAERASGWRADLVFFCYLDSYLRFSPFPIVPDLFLRRPWSGLYFRTAHLGQSNGTLVGALRRAAKGDLLLRNRHCRAVCVLDERFNDSLTEYCGHPVIPFPDMTDETVSGTPAAAAAAIRAQAAGRRIIGLVSMEKRKGLLTLLRAALHAHELHEPWFFVATGPFYRSTFTAAELAFCDEVARRAGSGDLDNLYFDTSGARIPDGPPYNSIFTTFDLVWAAYEDFDGSSNALTKAAAFRIPVLATAGHCVGARVDRHQLGRTFPQADVAACLEAIRSALANTGPDGRPLSPEFDLYHRLHSRDRLDEIFRSLLGGRPPA